MANKVTVQKEGGEAQTIDGVSTVRDAANRVGAENHTANVNGDPATMDTVLADFAYVSFAKKDKAGA